MELMKIPPREIEERVARLKAVAITPENAKKNEDLRTEGNAYVKSIKNQIKALKEEYLKPFTEQEKAVLEALKPLEDELKAFSESVLEAKKIAFRNKVYQEWTYLVQMDMDGNIAPFEEIYDPSWYGDAEKEWKPKLIAAWKSYVTSGEIVNATFHLERVSMGSVREIEKIIIEKRIMYRKEIEQ